MLKCYNVVLIGPILRRRNWIHTCRVGIRRKANMIDLAQARKFVKAIDISGTPRGIRSQSAATEAGAVFEQAKTQAQVVGSALFSFAQGVEINVREAISDSALLAQLVANKRASAENVPLEWFAEYAKVLLNVGWTLQEGGWT